MTEFQTPPPSGYSLATLRVAIDTHDEAILNALTARQRLVDRIRDVKNREGEKVYRPAREAQILRKLLAMADPALDKTLVHQLWREIFSSAVSRQSPLTIAVVEEGASLIEITRQHFGHAAKLRVHDVAGALNELLTSAVDLAVLPAVAAPDIIAIARQDAAVRINGMLPFLSDGGLPTAYVIGRLPMEETGDDITLIAEGDTIAWLDGFQPAHPACIGIAPRPWTANV